MIDFTGGTKLTDDNDGSAQQAYQCLK